MIMRSPTLGRSKGAGLASSQRPVMSRRISVTGDTHHRGSLQAQMPAQIVDNFVGHF
jgi:hypothetical protein